MDMGGQRGASPRTLCSRILPGETYNLAKSEQHMRQQTAMLFRETYKADEALQQGEKKKQDQDRLVLHLQRQIEVQHAKLARLQGLSQKEVTISKATAESIKETTSAAEDVKAETKGLLQHWKEDVASLHREDECLQVNVLLMIRSINLSSKVAFVHQTSSEKASMHAEECRVSDFCRPLPVL